MKLGLLVALAVAAVVAGLSDGRNVTECELKQTLASAIVLPSFLQRYKDNILAAVICKVKLMSQLNSGLVTVKGTCPTTPQPTTPEPTTPELTTPEPTTPEPTTPEPTTPEPTTPEPTTPEPTTPEPTTPEPTTPEPTTPEPTTPEPTTPEPTTPEPTTPEPTTPEPTTPQPTTPEPTTPGPTTPEPTTPGPTTPEPTTPQPTTPEPTTPQPTTPEPTTPEPTTPQPTTPEPTTPGPTIPATTSVIVGKRRKRAVPINIEELNNLDKVLKKLVKNGRVNLFMEDDYNHCNRMGHRVDSHEDDSHDDDSHEDDSHEEEGKGGARPSCLGFYGLFQLSDGYFCDSGNRPSKNVCGLNCAAFTDDNIVDDVDCLVKTNFWWYLLENTPGFCFNSGALVSSCGV